MHKSRRLRKKREDRLPVIIYTEYPEPDRVKRIKEVWVNTTGWPAVIFGPGETVSHPDYINYNYRKV